MKKRAPAMLQNSSSTSNFFTKASFGSLEENGMEWNE
jgi:hypothetical protein